MPDDVNDSIKKLQHWFMVWPHNETDQVTLSNFCDMICRSLEDFPAPGGIDNDRIFMWDNLKSHTTALVYLTVEGQLTPNLFWIVQRLPYQPKYATIKYIICQLTTELSRGITVQDNTETMTMKIEQIASHVGRDGKANNTFENCGY